jgi:uncharacterized phage protein (TIGR01671 family)
VADVRDIKFRAWDKKTGSMFAVTNVRMNYQGVKEVRIAGKVTTDSTAYSTPNDRLIAGRVELMQSTGLEDKNGKEIYEGDIVSYKVGSVKTGGPVKWSEEGAQWIKGNNQALSTYQKTTEILGNIYENPGLLI